MKIYTGKGDDGSTSLPGGKRVPKYHTRVEAYGSIDELIAWVGLLRDLKENKSRASNLIYIQEQLMLCAIILATEKDYLKADHLPDKECVLFLENEIDSMEANLPPLKNFLLPGGHIVLSYCHITRCVCRRAERAAIKLNNSEEIPEIIIKFLNRLSDYFFILSRQISLELGIEEIRWSR